MSAPVKVEQGRLLWFSLVVDDEDPALGFCTSWIAEMAGRYEAVDVFTVRIGRHNLPANVRVFGLPPASQGRLRRSLVFFRQLAILLVRGRPRRCFSHMNPLFIALAGPLLRLRGVSTVTWYAHKRVTWALRLANVFTGRFVTSVGPALQLKTRKKRVIGQAIDTSRFTRSETRTRTWDILMAGRIAAVKRIHILAEALPEVARRFPSVRVGLVGDVYGETDAEYRRSILETLASHGLAENVEWLSGIHYGQMAAIMARTRVLVNLTGYGSGDKVVLECMSCEIPALTDNPGFRDCLAPHEPELFLETSAPGEVAAKLNRLLGRSDAELDRMGAQLRENVRRHHSLQSLPDRVDAVFRELEGTD